MSDFDLAKDVFITLQLATASNEVKMINEKPHIKIGEIAEFLSGRRNEPVSAQMVGRILRQFDMEISKRQRDGYWVSLDRSRIEAFRAEILKRRRIEAIKAEFRFDQDLLALEINRLRNVIAGG